MVRNAILINQLIVELLPLNKDLVFDELQNFCVSQFFPDNFTIAVGKESQFVYDGDYRQALWEKAENRKRMYSSQWRLRMNLFF